MKNIENAFEGELSAKLFCALKLRGQPFGLKVTGRSMQPTIYENDEVTVQPMDDYAIGDVLVFLCDEYGSRTHRFLAKENDMFICKGDNAFGSEEVAKEQIIGKVIAVNGKPLSPCPKKLVALSLAVNSKFEMLGGSIKYTKETDTYRLYKKLFLDEEREDIVVYQKNMDMDYTIMNDASVSVVNPESEDMFFFDKAGIDILNQLDEPCDLEMLTERLCDIYNVLPEDIKIKLEAFLAEFVDEKVIVVL